MSRFVMSLSIVVVTLGLGIVFALAQSTTGDSAKSDRVVQEKMKNSEDPSSPQMQQAAAKQAECKKQAKAKKLRGAERRAFMKDCTK